MSAVAAATAPLAAGGGGSTRSGRTALVGCALAAVGVGPWWARDAAAHAVGGVDRGARDDRGPGGLDGRAHHGGAGGRRGCRCPHLAACRRCTSHSPSRRSLRRCPTSPNPARPAIDVAPSGAFVDFRADGEVGGRPAVTYRELRAGSRTDWAVIVDGDVRIAVGCQTGRGPAERLGEECLRAVRSAGGALKSARRQGNRNATRCVQLCTTHEHGRIRDADPVRTLGLRPHHRL